MNIFDIAKQNQEKAWQVIKNTNIIQIWEDAGAKIGRFTQNRAADET